MPSRWREKCFSPLSFSPALRDTLGGDSGNSGYRLGSNQLSHADGSARVIRLFGAWYPAAIMRRVRAVVVDALNAVIASWGRTQIPVEGFKRVSPLVRHGDASAAVAIEPGRCGVVAALSNIAPDVVLSRAAHPVAEIYAFGPCRGELSVQASTAFTASARKELAGDRSLRSTLAPADPVTPWSGCAAFMGGPANHGQPVKNAPDQVMRWHTSFYQSMGLARG